MSKSSCHECNGAGLLRSLTGDLDEAVICGSCQGSGMHKGLVSGLPAYTGRWNLPTIRRVRVAEGSSETMTYADFLKNYPAG